jgi:hypothetical protein
MSPTPHYPWMPRLNELLVESRTRQLSAAERKELNDILRTRPEARAAAAQWLADDVVLTEELRAAQMEALVYADTPQGPGRVITKYRSWFQWSATAAAAGVVVGFLCASMAWAIAVPWGAVTEWMVLFQDGFEDKNGPLAPGFPFRTGVWSGDPAEYSAKLKNGGGLRFIQAVGDRNSRDGRANSCDAFRILDLSHLKTQLESDTESILELSAEFLDTRPEPGRPVHLACHIYLFEGKPEALQPLWPVALRDVLGSSVGYEDSVGGGDTGREIKVSTRCSLHPKADYAVIHVGAGRTTRNGTEPLDLGAQYVSNVQVALKTASLSGKRVLGR